MAKMTVGELFSQWDKYQKQVRVWEFLRDSLDKTVKLSREAPEAAIIRMADGRSVDEEVVLSVLAEIDGAIADLKQAVSAMEGMAIHAAD